MSPLVKYGYFLDHPFDSYGATKKSVTESSMIESSMRGNSSACMKVKNDPRSEFSNLSNWKEEA